MLGAHSLLFTLYFFAASLTVPGGVNPYSAKVSVSAQPESETTRNQKPAGQTADSELQQEPFDEELAPAAMQLDTSKTSPLIRALYHSTRETKDDAILAQLVEAKKLVENGADLKATDAQGRTALHWAVFGSSYTNKAKILVAYEEVASGLIDRGVEVNREDVYNNTALDYMLYSPHFEMQTLLIEHGASSGFLAAFFNFFNQASICDPESPGNRIPASGKADLLPGQTMDIRLEVPVGSDRSRTGDPVEATVTYPLCMHGELVACAPGDLLIAPGTKINGTVLFAQKAPDKYSRPRLVLDFSNIVYKDGRQSPLYARVLDVDNARETVRNNEILGIIQPHAATKVSFALAAVGTANPLAGYTIQGVQAVYGLSLRREIFFPVGTDMQIQVVHASTLKEKASWAGWPTLSVTPELRALVVAAPGRTHNGKTTPSDVTNLMFLGTRQQIITAFTEAGWFQADSVNVGTALKTVQATIRQSGYTTAPVSTLRINGQPPDLVFQKSLNTFAKRHHLRIWKQAAMYDGQEVWVGAATHDIAIEKGRAGTKWTHRIDPHIDRERAWIVSDFLFIGTMRGYADIDRPAAPRKTSNATGDEILTDGKMSVVDVGSSKRQN